MGKITGDSPDKAWVVRYTDEVVQSEYMFQFNPTAISRNTTAEYTLVSPPGSVDPTAIFRAISGKKLDISIFVDSTTSYFRRTARESSITAESSIYGSNNSVTSVDMDIAFWESLVFPDIGPYLEGGAKWTSPPRVMFGYGQKYWNVVVTDVRVSEQMFDKSMRCLRAQIDASMQSIWIGKTGTVTEAENFNSLRAPVEIKENSLKYSYMAEWADSLMEE